MLYADKQALETDLKVCLLAIRERELSFYTQNCRAIGTSAALLAGFAYSGLSTTSDFAADTSEFMRGFFLVITTSAMSLNIAAMASATWCSMLGPGLALRGPDGSMDQAVEGLALEYRVIFLLFVAGLLCFFTSALLLLCNEFDYLLSTILSLLLLMYLRQMWHSCKRIYKKFRLPVNLAVAGSFNPDGSRGNAVGGYSKEEAELEVLRSNKRFYEWPRRNYLYMRLFYDEFLGVSESVYEQRYERTAFGRAYNYTIHNVIRYLERPDISPYAADKPSGSSTREKSLGFDERRRRNSRDRMMSLHGGGATCRVLPSADGGDGGDGGDADGSSGGLPTPPRRRGVFGLARRLGWHGEQGARLRDSCEGAGSSSSAHAGPGPLGHGGLLEGTHASGVISPADSLCAAAPPPFCALSAPTARR